MKSKILSLKPIIRKLKKQLLCNETLEKKKRFAVACKQFNREKYLILVMLKNTINNL